MLSFIPISPLNSNTVKCVHIIYVVCIWGFYVSNLKSPSIVDKESCPQTSFWITAQPIDRQSSTYLQLMSINIEQHVALNALLQEHLLVCPQSYLTQPCCSDIRSPRQHHVTVHLYPRISSCLLWGRCWRS